MTKEEINRRDFLKLSSSTAVMLGLSSIPGTLGALGTNQNKFQGSTKFVTSVCEMCTSSCTIQARVENGKGVFIKGNPNDKSRGGRVCARGGSGFKQMYDDKRLINPIMRVGKRGEGKWKEVTWDEAYTYIAEKLSHIKETYGARSVAWTARSGWAKVWFHHLAKAYGSVNIFGHESTCPLAYSMSGKDVYGNSIGRDFANADYIINMGHNVFEGIVISYARQYMTAIQNGAKVVSLEPRLSMMAAKASEWHKIKPGHDLPFVLAFMNVLIEDKLYDKEFVDKYCVGFNELKESIKDYTPEVMAKECDIDAKDIRRLAHEFSQAAPKAIFDYGHRVTLSAQELELRRAIMMINALVGAVETKGGYYFAKKPAFYNSFLGENDPKVPTLKKPKTPAYPKTNDVRIDRIGEKDCEFFLASKSQGITTLVPKSALGKIPDIPYEIKAWFIVRNNPVMNYSNYNEVLAGINAMELVVAVDFQLSDTTEYADIVLPDTTYLERDQEFTEGGGKNPSFSVGRQKVVEPIGGKPTWLIAKELANKMGLGEYFPWVNIEDYRLQQVENDLDLLAELKVKGLKSFGVPLLLQDKQSVANFVKKYPGAAKHVNKDGVIDFPKKIKLFSPELERISKTGGLNYVPFKYKEDDELYFINGKSAVRTNGAGGNNVWLNNLMSEAAVWIHPKTAKNLGISNGDNIELSNKYATQHGHAMLSEGIREDTLFAYYGFGHTCEDLRFHSKGVHCNSLNPSFTGKNSGMDLHTTGVKIRKV